MPGEIAGSLWTANESAFKKVKKHMEEGRRIYLAGVVDIFLWTLKTL
jgi:hypothetical protein